MRSWQCGFAFLNHLWSLFLYLPLVAYITLRKRSFCKGFVKLSMLWTLDLLATSSMCILNYIEYIDFKLPGNYSLLQVSSDSDSEELNLPSSCEFLKKAFGLFLLSLCSDFIYWYSLYYPADLTLATSDTIS